MNTPVSFEIAKLLKEKGFDEQLNYYYDSFGDIGSSNIKVNWNNSEELLCSAPTITEAVMWLYDKHGIWIFPDRTNKWFWTIQKPNSEYIHQEDLPLTEKSIYNGFNSPTEAYEAAITYTLNNLI